MKMRIIPIDNKKGFANMCTSVRKPVEDNKQFFSVRVNTPSR